MQYESAVEAKLAWMNSDDDMMDDERCACMTAVCGMVWKNKKCRPCFLLVRAITDNDLYVERFCHLQDSDIIISNKKLNLNRGVSR